MQHLLIGVNEAIISSDKWYEHKKVEVSMMQKCVNHKLPLKITLITTILNDTILDFIKKYKGKHLEIGFPACNTEDILDACNKNIYTKKLFLTLFGSGTHISDKLEKMFNELVILQPNLYIVKVQQYDENYKILRNCDKINNILFVRSYNRKIRNTKLFELLLS